MKHDMHKLVPFVPAVAVALALYVSISTAYASVTKQTSPGAYGEAHKNSNGSLDDFAPFAITGVVAAENRGRFTETICGSAPACAGSFANASTHARSRRHDLPLASDGRDRSSSDFTLLSSDYSPSDIAAASRGDELHLVSPASPVPEPEAYALLMVGLGLIGTIARRRRHD